MEFNIILKWPRLSVPLNRIHTRYIVKVPRSACIHMKKKCNIISIMVIHNDRTLFFNCSRKSIKMGIMLILQQYILTLKLLKKPLHN